MSDDESPVYAAFIPNSPQRFVFKELKEVKQFLNSPDNKKLNKSVRFKRCANDSEVDSFYNDSALDFSTENIQTTSSVPVEPKALFSEPEPPRLNRFRVFVERKDEQSFDSFVEENPRFLLNSTVDGPTILQGAQRHNILHIACSAGNIYVVNRVLELLESEEFLMKAYGQIQDIDVLVDHLLDSFLNTPDKNANNSPLHFAAKNGHFEIVKKLVSFGICRRNPVNRFGKVPLDLVCETFKGTAGEKLKASGEIKKLLYSISTPTKPKVNKKMRNLNMNFANLNFNQSSQQATVSTNSDDEEFFDALDYADFVSDAKMAADVEMDDDFYDALEPLNDSMDQLTAIMNK